MTIQLSCRNTCLLCRTMVSTLRGQLAKARGRQGRSAAAHLRICLPFMALSTKRERHLGLKPVEGLRTRTSRAFVTSHTKSSAHSMLTFPRACVAGERLPKATLSAVSEHLTRHLRPSNHSANEVRPSQLIARSLIQHDSSGLLCRHC